MLPGNTYTLENYVFVCTFRNMVTRRGALSSSQEVNENFSPVSLSYFVIALPGIRKKSGRKNYLRTAIFSLPQTVNLANPKRFPKINNLVRYRYRERNFEGRKCKKFYHYALTNVFYMDDSKNVTSLY